MAMKRYDNIVLNKLLDSYENSAAYASEHFRDREHDHGICTGERPSQAANTCRRGIFCRIDRKSFPEYFDTASGAYEILHQQLQDLEQKGMIRLYWKGGEKGHILEKAGLEICKADECYKYLSRKPRWQKEAEIAGICRKYYSILELQHSDTGSFIIMARFLEWVLSRLGSGESIKRFVDADDHTGFDRLCRLLLSILTNDQDVYLRQFSISVFGDSKIAEKELERGISLIREFSKEPEGGIEEDYSGLSSDEILEAFGIYRNPVWLYMKGNAGIRIGGDSSFMTVISSLDNGIGVTLHDLKRLSFDRECSPECILTIENLTTFFQQETVVAGMNALVIYLGGYAGRQKREFLRKLQIAYPDAKFMHFGDIDCGGFRIWKALCEGTGISIDTYRMDERTFEKFAKNGKTLNAHDKKQLTEMKKDPFYSGQYALFERMLEAGIKLEQESII